MLKRRYNISAYDQIKNFLMDRGETGATNGEIASFMAGKPGQLSTGQRIREIRQEVNELGGELICKRESKGNFRYILRTKKEPVYFTGEQGQMRMFG